MRRIPRDMLERMARAVSQEDKDEMAIPSYLHSNPAMRWMAWKRVTVTAQFMRNSHQPRNEESAQTIMDFGCGTGVLFDESSQYADTVYGVDIVLEPATLLVDEWRLDKVSLLSPEQAEIQIPENSIDTIIAAEVLEHIDPLDSTLEFFRSRLGANGNLIVSLPTESLLYRIGRRVAGFEGHYHLSNASSIHQQILQAGFKETRLKKIPAPGPFAIYWVIEYQPR
jgi:2-polyprenyl-3-methyl-5-hydroxy-6-metoxy-1,4-benzoquinol methylase